MSEEPASHPIETCYLSASGASHEDCVFIGQRYDADRGFKPREAESWLMLHTRVEAGVQTSAHLPSSTWYTAVWRAPSGQVFLADAVNRAVYRCPALTGPEGGVWSDERLPAAIQGLWGIDDNNVYAWGGNREGFPLFHWDGAAWHAMTAPGFELYALHGTAPNCLWAVGDAGQVAFWDGGRWYPFPTPTREVLNGVFVRGRDHVYATGEQGSLLEGATHGWTKICDGPVVGMPLFAVAWWGDALWVAARQWGLLRRVGRSAALEVVKPNVWATHLEARENLLITEPQRVVATADGKTFSAAGAGKLDEFTGGRRLHYFRRGAT